MASRKRLTTNTVFQAAEAPVVEETIVEETVVEETVVEETAVAAPPAVEGNDDLAQKVEALEAKVNDLIAKLSRKMSL